MATSSTQVNAPSFFHLSVLKDVNWEETPSFIQEKTPLKGIEEKSQWLIALLSQMKKMKSCGTF
ncbi:DUF4871 domain-containing protein [Bacillus cereus]